MAIIKCKMCGGDLELIEGQSVAECEYCGSRQTVPNQDNEKKLLQFERAERLRKNCEFDKAASLFEAIVAEHRQEAEAYWGLVLCKYGIEYVDDPGTGKKIPTCHRSSFDSVMEDCDFDQVLENADSVARRVYREEAKRIEEIRRGIIAVSANEEPYDIFICYKETDEKGDRTLDSVLAQDIYDALTDKGYRVFFARITLEDKLGQEYEPYIFAALNSAKVMLAVGTDYEYYNAVWVKNEWSRFLKLMARDKHKYLIPCFKGLDAYDLPREFARLQAQDLGKMGAIQDLLRNMEKYIPLAKSAGQTVVREQVVVGGTAGNKIASALHRGNMALEDGEWAKADSFFEDVLSNDSMNAQAYLGKTLALEKCRSLDAFIRKRLDGAKIAFGMTLQLNSDQAHIREMAERYALPGYVAEDEIRDLYKFDLGYHSKAADRMQQYQNEEAYWAGHKLLTKAEKFAQGDVAETLTREKKRLFDTLDQQVKQAEKEEAAAVEELKQRYARHLKQADEKAQALYEEGCERREKDYEENLRTAKNTEDPAVLIKCAEKFAALGDFRDSMALAEQCRRRAGEIREEIRQKEIAEKARLAEEEERRVIAQRKAEREAAEKKKKKTILAVAVSVAAVAVIILASSLIKSAKSRNAYESAIELAQAGEYGRAIDLFESLGDYEDSAYYLLKTRKALDYSVGMALMANGNYEQAMEHFKAAGDYEDAEEQLSNAQEKLTEQKNAALYLQAEAILEQGDLAEAARIFSSLGDFRDSRTRCQEVHYELGIQYLMQGNHTDAYREFSDAGEYADAQTLLGQFQHRIVQMGYYKNGKHGTETYYTYNEEGKLVKADEKTPSLNEGVERPDITEYFYNSDGTLAKTITPYGWSNNEVSSSYTAEYDEKGSPVRIFSVPGSTTVTSFSYEYGEGDRVNSVTLTFSRKDLSESKTFDFTNEPVPYYVEYIVSSGMQVHLRAVAEDGSYERYSLAAYWIGTDQYELRNYKDAFFEVDEQGNPVKKILWKADGSLLSEHRIENVYDKDGNLIRSTQVNVANDDTTAYTYTYGYIFCGELPAGSYDEEAYAVPEVNSVWTVDSSSDPMVIRCVVQGDYGDGITIDPDQKLTAVVTMVPACSNDRDLAYYSIRLYEDMQTPVNFAGLGTINLPAYVAGSKCTLEVTQQGWELRLSNVQTQYFDVHKRLARGIDIEFSIEGDGRAYQFTIPADTYADACNALMMEYGYEDYDIINDW